MLSIPRQGSADQQSFSCKEGLDEKHVRLFTHFFGGPKGREVVQWEKTAAAMPLLSLMLPSDEMNSKIRVVSSSFLVVVCVQLPCVDKDVGI